MPAHIGPGTVSLYVDGRLDGTVAVAATRPPSQIAIGRASHRQISLTRWLQQIGHGAPRAVSVVDGGGVQHALAPAAVATLALRVTPRGRVQLCHLLTGDGSGRGHADGSGKGGRVGGGGVKRRQARVLDGIAAIAVWDTAAAGVTRLDGVRQGAGIGSVTPSGAN